MDAQAQAPRIETERLVLRPPCAADAVYLAELANDPEVARMTTGVPYPYRLADAEGFLAASARADVEAERPLLIEHRQFGPIGMAGFHRDPGSALTELGYWLGRTFRGRGLATEAVGAALSWAGQGWGKRAVLSSHFADNPASARVLDKAGFLYTGEVRRRFSVGRGRHVDSRMMVWLA
jgi:RimJ/RimL family protein N-acetyltransferase